MKIYKHDKRFAVDVLANGWVGVFVLGEDGYKLQDKAIDKQAAYQRIFMLTDKKKYVRDEDFEEIK